MCGTSAADSVTTTITFSASRDVNTGTGDMKPAIGLKSSARDSGAVHGFSQVYNTTASTGGSRRRGRRAARYFPCSGRASHNCTA